MEKLVQNIYKALKTKYQIEIIGPTGCKEFVDTNTSVIVCPASPIFVFLLCSFIMSLYRALRFRPAIVFGGSGLVAPAVVCVSKIVGVRSTCYLHGLDIVADNVLYRMVFLPAIRALDTVIVNSRNTAKLAEEVGIHASKLNILHPSVSFESSYPLQPGRKDNLLSDSDTHCKILLSVGRLTDRKGLAEFVEHAMPALVSKFSDLKLIIIGDSATDAVKSTSNQIEKITSIAKSLDLQEHVKLLGIVDDATLNTAYEMSDVLVFPVLPKKDDVEGFGIVAIEAAAHGLPTVAFNVGGVSDAVSNNISGYLVESGNYSVLVNSIAMILDKQADITAKSCREFAMGFSRSEFERNLLSICG